MVPTVTFTVTSGPMKGRQLVFRDRSFLSVGRSPECQVCLGETSDLTVSRRHCLFEFDPPTILVRDLNSLNGTYVNGIRLGGPGGDGPARPDRLAQLTLYHGDVVRVGETCFQVTTSQEPTDRAPVLGEDAGEMTCFPRPQPAMV